MSDDNFTFTASHAAHDLPPYAARVTEEKREVCESTGCLRGFHAPDNVSQLRRRLRDPSSQLRQPESATSPIISTAYRNDVNCKISGRNLND